MFRSISLLVSCEQERLIYGAVKEGGVGSWIMS